MYIPSTDVNSTRIDPNVYCATVELHSNSKVRNVFCFVVVITLPLMISYRVAVLKSTVMVISTTVIL